MQIIVLARSETLRPRLLASHGSHLRLQEYSDYDPIAVRWVFSYLYSDQDCTAACLTCPTWTWRRPTTRTRDK